MTLVGFWKEFAVAAEIYPFILSIPPSLAMFPRMAETNQPSAPAPPPHRQARRLRMTGVVVLALGLAAAGMVYWLGTRGPDLSNDPSMQGFNRTQQRQMGQLYGKSGQVIDEWFDDLKRPGTRAVLIAGFSIAVFAGCFYFARLLESDDEPA